MRVRPWAVCCEWSAGDAFARAAGAAGIRLSATHSLRPPRHRKNATNLTHQPTLQQCHHPNTCAGVTFVSVGHRPTLTQFHDSVLLLHGGLRVPAALPCNGAGRAGAAGGTGASLSRADGAGTCSYRLWPHLEALPAPASSSELVSHPPSAHCRVWHGAGRR